MKRPAVLQRQGGRRIKKVPKGERTQIGVIVGGNTKARLLKSMKESGRTISREVEHLIEKAHAYDDVVATVTRAPGPPHPGDLEEIQRRNVEADLARLGYPMQRRIIDGKVWKTWAEPGFPGTQAGGDRRAGGSAMKGHLTRRGERSWRLKYDLPRARPGERQQRSVTLRGTRKRHKRKPPRSSPASPAASTLIPRARPSHPSSSAGCATGPTRTSATRRLRGTSSYCASTFAPTSDPSRCRNCARPTCRRSTPPWPRTGLRIAPGCTCTESCRRC